ncbi:MAG: DUF3459 domain-containing protein [Deltaproteobacteria bacterium]|nr:DUF3459 domain-containing protein [Deltaproteobacteria bacterium]
MPRPPLVLAAIPTLLCTCVHRPDSGRDANPPDALAPKDATTPDSSGPDGGVRDARVEPGDSGALPNADGWWRSAVFYEVFVRSFKDSNGDGIGDLRGIIEKLDTLNDGNSTTSSDLGVDALWLMPIHPSPSYHGYDVTDYQAVNPQYGTLSDFDELIQEAHRRGIRIILDFVLNHSSSEHPWFVDARSSSTAAHRAFYSWSPVSRAGWQRPWDGAPVWHRTGTGWYYGLFWSGMPDLNLGNPSTEQAMTEAARFWLARGVDGFRVDAARYLFESADGRLYARPETHAFIQRLRRNLSDEYPAALFVAEAWADLEEIETYYGQGDEYQLAFQFDLSDAIKASVHDSVKANLNQSSAAFVTAFPDQGYGAPFLSNHDQPRVMRQLDGLAPRARLAAATLFAMPGTPFLYYGEELGMQGGPASRDEDKRTPMRWTSSGPSFGFSSASRTWYEVSTSTTSREATGVTFETQRSDPTSLWTLYRDLVALRHRTPALSGRLDLPTVTNAQRGIYAALRTFGDQRVLFVANLHFQPATAFSIDVPGAPNVLLEEGLDAAPTRADQLEFTGLAPQSFAFIELR